LLFFQVLHWIGFGLDELLFRNYRKVKITKPIFITGIPRSGTTHLQRVLAKHEVLTCMKTWECLLAPSITERYFYRLLGRIGKPISHYFGKSNLPFFREMGSIHALGLQENEEDFIALLSINACFLLVIFFPEVKNYWQLVCFDFAMPEKRKRIVIEFYARLIQKHLLFHGVDKRYLCKNPSFLTWIHSLKQSFPDAGFVICERPAEQTVPSQLSSLMPAWQLIYGESMCTRFACRLVNMLADYYHYIDKLPVTARNLSRLAMNDLVTNLPGSVSAIALNLELPLSEDFLSKLENQAKSSASYQSQHAYRDLLHFNWRAQKNLFPESAWSQGV